jgi:hypothetical protein
MAKDRTTIGQMREQVTILTVSDIPFGEYSVENKYSVKHSLRSRVRSMEVTESKNGIGRSDNERTHLFIVRNGASISIDSTNMILWRHDYYKVIGVEEIARNVDDPKKRYLRIEAVFDSEETAYMNPAPEST